MKRKYISVLLLAGALLGVGVILPANHVQASTLSKWGATKLYTAPKAIRGTWYYRLNGKYYKTKITAHKLDNVTLYRSPKNFSSLLGKLEDLPDSEQVKVRKSFSKIAEGSTIKGWHGINSLTIHPWLPAWGFGSHYAPVTRTRKGVKIRALRIDYGAGHLLVAYAYPSKKLAEPESSSSVLKQWGATKKFTTPKATRGTWYYKDSGKIVKLKIDANKVNGIPLYKLLSIKQDEKLDDKLLNLSSAKQNKWHAYFDNHARACYSYKWHGKTGFNCNVWLAGGGNGFYYTPVTKTRYGIKTKAIRIGSGAGNWLYKYAYPSKDLAK
ncbi:MAG: hypothetical protein PUF82_05455 [Lactobacillus equicursoris]|uniref:hypothetical protein n=1 Tax=Lactobacillus equicursoris TaxID=420645 RepID=UPI00242DA383|nr:hypothetical protein [Lactobacillus equicursoris]MDD6407426.1 hypothetical protein [Lactobacillus equicursoris]